MPTLLPSNTVHFVRYMAASGACSKCNLKHEHALMQFVQQSIVNASNENASHIQRLIQTMLMGTKNEEGKLEQLIKNFANCCFLGMPLPEYPTPARCRPDISVCDNLLFDVGGKIYENVYCDARFSVPGLEKAQKKNQTYSVNVVESITWAKENMTHFTTTRDIEQGQHTFGQAEEGTTEPIIYIVKLFHEFADASLKTKYDQAFGYYKWIECTTGNVAHPEDGRMGIVIMKGTGKASDKFELAKTEIGSTLKKVELNDDGVSVYMTYDAVADENLLKPEDIGSIADREAAAKAAIPVAGGGVDLTSDFARMSLRGAGRGLGLRPQELAEVLELAS